MLDKLFFFFVVAHLDQAFHSPFLEQVPLTKKKKTSFQKF